MNDCPIHGAPTKRASCKPCNAAYQRQYLRHRRVNAPAKEMWRRAQARSRKRGIKFAIKDDLVIPARCPVLNLVLTPGGKRSATSPSLDRINPALGYIPGNVRIISDRANRLKGNRALPELRGLAATGPKSLRDDYARVVAYVDREALLSEVRLKAGGSGRMADEWRKIAAFLEAAFQRQCP